MSEEQENKTETTVEEPKEIAQPTQEDVGKKYVEFTPEQEARFKRIYGHMKESERNFKTMAQMNRQLLDKMEDMERRFGVKETKESLDALKAEKKAAYESGNIDRVLEIDEQILDLRTKPEKKVETKQEKDPKQVAEEWLTPENKAKLTAWADEKDASGNLLRPWASPAHPKHARAIEMFAGVLNDPDFSEENLDDVFAEVDRLMGVSKPKAVRNMTSVVNGDGNVSRAPDETKLSEEQKRIARVMFPNDKEPLKRYAAAIKKWGVTA